MKKVYIGDDIRWPREEIEPRFNFINSWASQNCKSFIGMKVSDVSDVSIEYDYMAEFTFGDDVDVLLFVLRWK